MTDANTANLVDQYTTAYRAAQEIARRTAKVLYQFEIYLEDSTHGGQQVGTGVVRFRTVQPLRPNEPSAMHTLLVEPTGETRKALERGQPHEMRCRMTVQLYGFADPVEHCFESGPARMRVGSSDTGTHSFRIVDTTQDNPAQTWLLVVTVDTRSPLVVLRADFDLDTRAHAALGDLLCDEAADVLVERTLRLLPDADATARKRPRSE